MNGMVLRLPGRAFQPLVERAMKEAEAGGDLDLADALSHATVKRRGRGFQFFIELTPDQIDRLAEWAPESHRADLYKLADELRDMP